MDDKQLVKEALLDPEKYRKIMEKYTARLLQYIQLLIYVNKEDAEDILQEAYIKVYRNLNAYSEKFKFSSWIYRITHNEAVSFLRKNKMLKKRVSSGMEQAVFENFASETNVEHDVIKEMDNQKVHDILVMLDEKYKDVLLLKYVEEKDYEEIGDILKISPGTVGSLLTRGREKFKKLIAKQWK